MLILYATLLLPALSSAVAADRKSAPTYLKSKRGIVETGRSIPESYKFRQPKTHSHARGIQNSNSKLLSYHKDPKTSATGSPLNFDGVYTVPSPYVGLPSSVRHIDAQGNEQSSPYYGNLFTMSAGYKVANAVKPPKQKFLENQTSRNQNSAIGTYGVPSSSTRQVPIYKIGYSLPKFTGSQTFAPSFQNDPYGDIITGKKASLPLLQVQSKDNVGEYLANFANQPVAHFAGRTPKVNNVQLSAPFLSPLSSFQGQVVPISTAANNPQFPQYKGASIEVYPTVGGFSTTGYEPLQTQPQLHFGHNNVQPVEKSRQFPQSQEIRSDVEIINKMKPTTPPPKNDNDDEEEDEVDEDYTAVEKEYGSNSHDDEDDFQPKSKSEKHFRPPQSEGDFKPSTSFPFKQYDEKFGKYSSHGRDEDAEGKPYSKYRGYTSSNDDDDEDSSANNKYQSDDSSSRGYYGKHEEDDDEGEDDKEKGYERQNTEETYATYKPKHFHNGFDEEFESSYRKNTPKQKYTKEVPEAEYGSRSFRRNKDDYESEDSAGEGSRPTLKYAKTPRTFKDSEGDSSDILTRTLPQAYEGSFGYKIPERIKSYKR